MEWTADLRREWVEGADPLKLSVGDDNMPIYLSPRVFTSSSVGYFANTKITLPDGLRYQVTMSLVVIGSKGDTGKSTDLVTAVKDNRRPRSPRKPAKPRKQPEGSSDPSSPQDSPTGLPSNGKPIDDQPSMFQQE